MFFPKSSPIFGECQLGSTAEWGAEFLRRTEAELDRALSLAEDSTSPPVLLAAMKHAVFPGGARIRPLLCLAVAESCGDPDPEMSGAVAAALELLHCASLVHDDLACFDNAALRRGRPSVHRQFGEAAAVLAGDGLIFLAFECVARVGGDRHRPCAEAMLELSSAAGPRRGLVAGQACELDSPPDMIEYHRAKTGGLFEAAAALGAIAAGSNPSPWRHLGAKLGRAFQVADDIADAVSTPEALGKPVGRDAALKRPTAWRGLGRKDALLMLEPLLFEALDAIPGHAAPQFHGWLTAEMDRLMSSRLNWSLNRRIPAAC
jgi:geranylgeranyl diphosphate synthase type II